MESNKSKFEVITSLQNPKVKNFQHLQKSRERRIQNLFIVEGKKEIFRAMEAKYVCTHLFVCPEIFNQSIEGIIDLPGGETPKIYKVSPEIYAHIAYRKNTEGIIGWAIPVKHTLDQIRLKKNPLTLVLEGVEKPGNLGAIMRTADAAALDAIIIGDPKTDLYNPNVIRSSLGAVFTVPSGVDTSENTIQWLKKNNIKLFCTSPEASIPYDHVDFTGPSAIVLGTETTGLTQHWFSASDQNILIPMQGKVDSINVSVSAGIVLFEAVRQRRLSGE